MIANNVGRKSKTLWTANDEGKKIDFEQFNTGYEEADYIARDIAGGVRNGDYHYGDYAVLYRTNAQSRLFEERFIVSNIPYKIVGGVNFYARKEVKDLLAYLKTIDNARDDLAVRRILNVPKRGIGATTVNRVSDYAEAYDISFYDALKRADEIPSIGKAASKVKPFVNLIQVFRSKLEFISISDLLREVIEETGYVKELEAEGTDEAEARIENIDELLSKVVSYEESEEHPTLSGFLEEVALVADIDSLEDDSDYVVLMTLHSAKGLEFPKVYLAGMEDGLFPSYMSITSDDSSEQLEEERRLAYVGITRAMKELTITCAKQRMIRGETQYNKVSRFVKEIPLELLEGKAPVVSRKESDSSIENTWNVKPKRMTMRQQPSGQSMQARAFASVHTKEEKLPYDIADRVLHTRFGEGTVVAIVEGGRDYYGENGGVVFPNPNAPTGILMPLSEIEDIIQHNRNVIVVVDEAYIDFGGESALPLIEKYDNLLVVQTFSKSRSMAGMRIGYAMGNEKLIKYINDVKYSFNSYTMNQTALALGVEAIKDKAYFEETRQRVIATREWTKQELTKLGFSFGDSMSNFIFATHERVPAKELFEALKKEHIFVRYFSKERISNYLRISIGTKEEMEELIRFLKNYLQ